MLIAASLAITGCLRTHGTGDDGDGETTFGGPGHPGDPDYCIPSVHNSPERIAACCYNDCPMEVLDSSEFSMRTGPRVSLEGLCYDCPKTLDDAIHNLCTNCAVNGPFCEVHISCGVAFAKRAPGTDEQLLAFYDVATRGLVGATRHTGERYLHSVDGCCGDRFIAGEVPMYMPGCDPAPIEVECEPTDAGT